jgi:hypothetical protein
MFWFPDKHRNSDVNACVIREHDTARITKWVTGESTIEYDQLWTAMIGAGVAGGIFLSMLSIAAVG